MAVHYVGFRGDEYSRAQRIFGPPDFIHRWWDRRAQLEIADGDLVVFATGSAEAEPNPFAGPDLIEG